MLVAVSPLMTACSNEDKGQSPEKPVVTPAPKPEANNPPVAAPEKPAAVRKEEKKVAAEHPAPVKETKVQNAPPEPKKEEMDLMIDDMKGKVKSKYGN
ncbi:MAG: hypothetical protein HY280_10355 [Nitrospinae bacterium]|nr:hypothetical protein [Nitrospinota bacterium]